MDFFALYCQKSNMREFYFFTIKYIFNIFLALHHFSVTLNFKCVCLVIWGEIHASEPTLTIVYVHIWWVENIKYDPAKYL